MEFKSAKELLTLCKEHDMPISAVMRTRECTLGRRMKLAWMRAWPGHGISCVRLRMSR